MDWEWNVGRISDGTNKLQLSSSCLYKHLFTLILRNSKLSKFDATIALMNRTERTRLRYKSVWKPADDFVICSLAQSNVESFSGFGLRHHWSGKLLTHFRSASEHNIENRDQTNRVGTDRTWSHLSAGFKEDVALSSLGFGVKIARKKSTQS